MTNKRFGLLWKVLAVVLFLCAVTGAFFNGMSAVLLISSGHGSNGTYFSSAACREQIEEYQQAVASSIRYRLELEDENLSYLDRLWVEKAQGQLEEQLNPENTNFRYVLHSYDGSRVEDGNLKAGERIETAAAVRWYGLIGVRAGQVTLQQVEAGVGYINSFESVPPSLLQSLQVAAGAADSQDYTLILTCGLPGTWVVEDEFARGEAAFRQREDALPFMIAAGIGCVLTALICLIYLCLAAGRRRGQEGIHLNRQDRIWYDVYLFGISALAALLVTLLDGVLLWGSSDPMWLQLVQMALLGVLPGTVLGLALLLTTVTRCKAGVLWTNTLIAKVCRLAIWFFHTLPITGRLVFVFLCYQLGKVVLMGWFGPSSLVFVFLLDIALLLYLCWWLVNFNRLRRAGEALASGDLDYRADTGRMPQELRRHGEDLNNISGGMANAVQEQMKSERFKAELITNVSHDLKTPLTSIINYVDLLKKVDIQDETAKNYIQVLDNKSQRLKKLTEDLVEASKASTGTLAVNREKVGMTQLINQALGEYEEKLESHRLQVVTALPEEESYVYADGRHLWRVLDNLLSNCVKYAMEGTRIYLELQRGHGQVILSVKNISRDALNVPPEQLMERFVRGDQSRTTEGSGLGLSIARSLTELQGGAFELSVDGDLFKATVSLPQMV